jgi:hypothetical protein
MGTNNYANGNFMFGDLPRVSAGAGVKFPFGTLLPPGGRVVYLRSTGPQDGDDQSLVKRLFLTLSSALAQCRAGLADTVIVLPGHTENVTDALMLTNLVAGTRIIGVGCPYQDDAPQFRWTATASQWPITAKNVLISNLRLRLEGANGVVKAIVTTASGTSLVGNNIEVASGATAKATIAIEVGSAAHDCIIAANFMHGTETHNVTDLIKVVGGTVPLRLRIIDNTIIASATAANGLIHLTVAALRVNISRNVLYNTHTASTATIAVDNVAADGIIVENYSGILTDGVAASTGIVFAGTATMKCFQNFTSDEPRKSGALSPAAVAT